MSALALNIKIRCEIIDANLEDAAIKKFAHDELKYGDTLSWEQAKTLYDRIHLAVTTKITDFMKSEDAQKICKDVGLFSAREYYSVVGDILGEKIFDIYKINLLSPEKSPEQSLSSRFWSLLGY